MEPKTHPFISRHIVADTMTWIEKLSQPDGVSIHELGDAELSAIQSTMNGTTGHRHKKLWMPYSRLASGAPPVWFGWVYLVTGIYTIVTKDSDVRLVLTTKRLSAMEFTALTLSGTSV